MEFKKIGLIAVLASVVTITGIAMLRQDVNAKIPEGVVLAYQQWSAKFGKVALTPAENSFRLRNFYQNWLDIESVNSQKLSYWFGLNEFSSLSAEEWNAKLTLKSQPEMMASSSLAEMPKANASGLQQQSGYNWISKLQTTYINGSGQCNDNYAWVAAVTHGGNINVRQGIQQPISPQTFVDCSGNFGNYGCNGGYPLNCQKYTQSWGANTMAQYPYYPGFQYPCKAPTGYMKNVNIYVVPTYSNSVLYNAIANTNIVSVAMDLSKALQYAGGIFSGPCSTTVNQALVLYGLGTQSGTDYWIAMNTWGPTWGDNGTIYVQRFTVDNNPTYSSCGINMYATFPTF